jgi:hypothetical protein
MKLCSRNIFLMMVFASLNIVAHVDTSKVFDKEYIIQFSFRQKPVELETIIPIKSSKQLSESMNIWWIKTVENLSNIQIDSIRKRKDVVSFSQNHKVNVRYTPNDSLLSKQWYLNTISLPSVQNPDIRALKAWDYNKNGVTANGDTMVIAILDEGFELDHRDLDYFINRKEIPNDSIDNDLNGAIDDYKGWNSALNNGAINNQSTQHGIAVAGIAGAKTNNISGIAGVAHTIKTLVISGPIEGGEAAVVSAYNFMINQKKSYIASNGNKGAFIIASNASIGIDNEFPVDHPMWCQIFDSLGYYGILNTVAATNIYGNVDIMGDIPTLCSSPYMIAVTMLTDSGKITSGYSKNSVDIAAPGYAIYSLAPSHKYANVGSGCSFAAPMVCGAIPLIYNNLSKRSLDSLKSNPSSYVLKIKNLLFENTDTTTYLKNYISFGGKLNLDKAIVATRSFSGTSQLINFSNQNPTFDFFYFDRKLSIENFSVQKELKLKIYNILGTLIYETTLNGMNQVLDIHQINAGIFIVRLENEETNEIVTKKIVIN